MGELLGEVEVRSWIREVYCRSIKEPRPHVGRHSGGRPTAVKDDTDGTPVIVEVVRCSQIEDGQQLASLQRLKKAADRSKAELHLLTEAECRQAGEDRAREWLAAKGLGALKVWAW
jgi:hypothetical protein